MGNMTTLPGDIPGILLRGSPINVNGGRSVVVVPELHWVAFATKTALNIAPIADVTLDLTDPTGRAHAEWWISRNFDRFGLGSYHDFEDLIPGAYGAVVNADCGEDMSPERIDTLARLVLKLAGRTS